MYFPTNTKIQNWNVSMNENYKTTTGTASTSNSKYDDFFIEYIVDYIFKAKTEENAVANAKYILKRYEDSLSGWQLIKLLFKK